jgi:hypothetical protein
VGRVVVVLEPVLLDLLLSVGDADKVMLREALTSEAVVEISDGRVVGRFARPTKVDAHLIPVAPVGERDRGELGAVVALNDRGDPALVAESAYRRHHVVGAQPNRWYQPDAFPLVQIGDAEHAGRGAIGELIVDEVHRPALVRGAALRRRFGRFRCWVTLSSPYSRWTRL